MLRVLLLSVCFLATPLFANTFNLVQEDVWGDRHYGDIYAEGDYAYIASDGVVVLDISVPSSPTQVTKISLPTFDEIIRVKKQGEHLFVMSIKEMFIVDVSDLSAASVVASFEYLQDHFFLDFEVVGTRLYTVGMNTPHITEYDISDITSPQMIGTKGFGAVSTMGLALASIDGALVVNIDDILYVVSTAEATKFKVLYTDQKEVNEQYSIIQTHGQQVYLANGNKVIRYDFSDLDNVSRSSVLMQDNPGEVYVRDMVIANNQLLILQESEEVSVRDLSVIMTELDSYYIHLNGRSVDRIKAADSVQLYGSATDIFVASREVEQSKYSFSSMSKSLDFNHNVLAYADEKLKLFDISKGKLELIEETDVGYSVNVKLQDDLLYNNMGFVFNTAAQVNKLDVVSAFGSHNISTTAIVQSDSNLYYLSSGELFAYDNSDPQNPLAIDKLVISDLNHPEIYYFTSLAVHQGHIFLGTSGQGLYHLYNDGSRITNLGSFGDSEIISSLHIVDSYLYQTYYGGLNIWDLSNLDSPLLAASYSEFSGARIGSSNPTHMDLVNNRLSIQYDEQFWLIDVTHPSSPEVIGNKEVPALSHSKDVKVLGDTLIAARDGQLKKYQINIAPVITTSLLTVNEDETLIQELPVSTWHAGVLTFEILTQASKGTVTVDHEGVVNFSPNKDEFGEDQFTVRVADNHGRSSEKEIRIDILPINDAPRVLDQTFVTNEDVELRSSLIVAEVDSDELQFVLVTDTLNGVVTLSESGEYSYQATANFNGTDSFTFSVTDGVNAAVEASVTINILAVNDAPVASHQSLNTGYNSEIASRLSAFDVDEDELMFEVVTNVSHGELALNDDGSFIYNPKTDFSGNDSFTYRVTDTAGSTSEAVVSITVSAKPKESTSDSSGGSLGYLCLLYLMLTVGYRQRFR